MEDEYEVETIRDHKKKGKVTFFYVKWKGYPETENTWEPESNLTHCTVMIKAYRVSQGGYGFVCVGYVNR